MHLLTGMGHHMPIVMEWRVRDVGAVLAGEQLDALCLGMFAPMLLVVFKTGEDGVAILTGKHADA